MKKNGFTLIELMVVIIIIAVVATIGMAGVNGITKNIKSNLWDKKVNLIKEGAINYGEDNKNLLVGYTSNTNCLKKSVNDLITSGYVSTKETVKVDDDKEKKVITNDTKENGEENYYVNDTEVCIWLDKNTVYAKYP